MIYLKTEINGIAHNVDIFEDELYSVCFKCGKEHSIDFSMMKEILNDGGDFSSTSISCGCSTEAIETTEKPTLRRIK